MHDPHTATHHGLGHGLGHGHAHGHGLGHGFSIPILKKCYYTCVKRSYTEILLPLGCNPGFSSSDVLDYLFNVAKKDLMAIEETDLVSRLVKAVASAREGMDMDALAMDAGMEPLTLQAGINVAFDRFTVDGIRSIIEAVRISATSFGASRWATPQNLFAIIGGSLPDPTISVVVTALALRIPLLLKPPSAHPAFAIALISGIQQADPVLGKCLGMVNKAGKDPKVKVFIEKAASVIVFGDDSTVLSVQQARPHRQTLTFGHQEAVEVISDTCTDEDFLAIARDICMYDQAGCLSPHIVALKQGVMPLETFSKRLYEALKSIERILPAGSVSFDDAARTRVFAQGLTGQGGCLAYPDVLLPNVAFNIPRPFMSGPGNRFIQVMEFGDGDDLFVVLKPLQQHIQAFAVHPDPQALVPLLQEHPDFAGAWLTYPGNLQSPPILWPENGRFMAIDLVTPLKVSKSE